MPKHDIFVIGTSAGGVEAMQVIASSLPADFPGSVFVVIHIPAQHPSIMPTILNRVGPLPAAHAVDNDPIKPGHIYIAPPDHHLLVERGFMRVVRGPIENRYRPSVDPLFRTAGRSYGPRAVGVILTGALDDGTAGLLHLKECWGTAVVQDPEDALFAGMPTSAIDNVKVDYIVPLAGIAPLLVKLASQEAPEKGDGRVPENIEIESKIAERELGELEDVEKIGNRSVLTCPDCHGLLWELRGGALLRYRCQVGHAYSAESMLSAQSDSLERALWAALRALEERAALVRQLAENSRNHNRDFAANQFEGKALEMEQHAEVMRHIVNGNSREVGAPVVQ